MSTCSYEQVCTSAVMIETDPSSRTGIDGCDVEHSPSGLAARRTRLIPGDAIESLAETFKLLGDATRVRMLDALSHGELCVCDLAALIGLSQSAVSHQLRLLRSMRLVRPRRAGRLVFYAIDDQHIMSLFQQGLRHVQEPGAPDAESR